MVPPEPVGVIRVGMLDDAARAACAAAYRPDQRARNRRRGGGWWPSWRRSGRVRFAENRTAGRGRGSHDTAHAAPWPGQEIKKTGVGAGCLLHGEENKMSSSKSSASQSQSQETADNRITGSGESVNLVASRSTIGNVSISQTDHGAVALY